MPIRWRLTIWSSLILCAVLVLSSVIIYVILQRYLGDEVDNNLRVNSARVHGTLNPQEIPEPLDYSVIHSKLPPINEFASPGIYIQLIDKDGNVVVKSDNLGSQELPVDPLLIERGFAGNVNIATVAAGNNTSVRIMVSPLYMSNQTLLLEVAQSLKYVDATMGRVRWALLASTLVALLLTGILGVVLVRRALSPVKRITQTAQSIEASSSLSRRVDYRGPMDEIGQLAATFDHMIEHLDKVFQSQKHFIGNASHELRGPLTIIRGNLDLLDRNLSKQERLDSLREVKGETVRMAKIVSDLLLLAQIESGQLDQQEAVPLREILLEESVRARKLAPNHQIIVGRQEDLSVSGSPHRIRQLLTNLVENAIRYTPEGGTITLSLSREGDWARLEVSDTGIGIAPGHLPHIFDRLYTVDKARSRASGGSGLGLAIVKGIAEEHGGKVTVISEPGKGSTFTVWLKL